MGVRSSIPLFLGPSSILPSAISWASWWSLWGSCHHEHVPAGHCLQQCLLPTSDPAVRPFSWVKTCSRRELSASILKVFLGRAILSCAEYLNRYLDKDKLCPESESPNCLSTHCSPDLSFPVNNIPWKNEHLESVNLCCESGPEEFISHLVRMYSFHSDLCP